MAYRHLPNTCILQQYDRAISLIPLYSSFQTSLTDPKENIRTSLYTLHFERLICVKSRCVRHLGRGFFGCCCFFSIQRCLSAAKEKKGRKKRKTRLLLSLAGPLDRIVPFWVVFWGVISFWKRECYSPGSFFCLLVSCLCCEKSVYSSAYWAPRLVFVSSCRLADQFQIGPNPYRDTSRHRLMDDTHLSWFFPWPWKGQSEHHGREMMLPHRSSQ